MPSQGRTTLPFFEIWSMILLMVSEGIANPTPWANGIIAVLMPMTLPSRSASGPPLLPGLMAASVCTRPSRTKSVPGSGRPSALMTPMDTVGAPGSPRALPIARTNWPTLRDSESPSAAEGRFSAFTLTSAMSVAASEPITSPTSVLPSLRWTWTLEASSMTWWLVTIVPLGSMMTPDPCPSMGTSPNLESRVSFVLSIPTTLSLSFSIAPVTWLSRPVSGMFSPRGPRWRSWFRDRRTRGRASWIHHLTRSPGPSPG